ncbi:MAG: DUF7714 family protein [Acidimicrobiales bacterium]
MSNLVPDRYRQVALATVDTPLTLAELRHHFLGKEAYRRTRYIVVRHQGEVGVLAVRKRDDEALFAPITDVTLLARADETALVTDPAVDVGVPTQLATAAHRLAPGARCVVAEGRYGHVSFICDPRPLRIQVVDIVPPEPAKLFDQARRVLEVADDLPPIELVPCTFDIGALARTVPSDEYLFPCRASGIDVGTAGTYFLDERPPRRDWVLVGPERSVEIHRWVYGDDPRTVVDICPHRIAKAVDGPVLTKCSLREEGIGQAGDCVVVPWGSSLATVHAGLSVLAKVPR